jgi:hypothetical protein
MKDWGSIPERRKFSSARSTRSHIATDLKIEVLSSSGPRSTRTTYWSWWQTHYDPSKRQNKKTQVNTALLPRKLFGTYFPRQTVTTCKCKSKSKAIPAQAWASPEGSRRLRLPRFPDIRHITLVRFSALSNGPRTYSWYWFLLEAKSTPGP